MRSILTPERTLSARQVLTHLRGIKHVALATVTAAGEPRVGPLDALVVRGRFHVGRGCRRRAEPPPGPAGDQPHPHRRRRDRRHRPRDGGPLGQGRPKAAALVPIYVDLYGSRPLEWAEGVGLIRIEADAMYA
jgi:hypothetical protein